MSSDSNGNGYRLPSGSRLSAYLACPGQGWLSAHHEPPSGASSRGSGIHAFIEATLNRLHDVESINPVRMAEVIGNAAAGALKEAAPEGSDWRATCEALDVGAMLSAGIDFDGVVAAEAAFAVNVETGRVKYLGMSLGRAYILAPGEMGLTIDAYLETVEGIPVAMEIKTGSRDKVPSLLSGKNAQVMLAAYAILQFTGAESILGKLVFIGPEGGFSAEVQSWSRFELGCWFDSVQRKLSAQYHDLNPGGQCEFCPAFRSCPAQVGLLVAMGRGVIEDDLAVALGQARLALDLMTPEITERALDRLKAFKTLLSRLETVMQEQPRELPGGRWYRPVKTTRRTLSPAATAAIYPWSVNYEKRVLTAERFVEGCRATGTNAKQAAAILRDARAYTVETGEAWKVVSSGPGEGSGSGDDE